MTPRERRSFFLEKCIPRVPHRFLILAAGFAWTIAGGMLVGKAMAWLLKSGDHLIARCAIASAGGLVFYFLLFSRISRRHIARIHAIDVARPSLFSFFGLKSYIMMASMIACGILLRTFKLVEPSILYTFYACMGTPLLLSAFRFYRSFATYRPSG
jgi:hypothetical protein